MNEQDEVTPTSESPTPGQVRDQAEHQQALQRFGGRMPGQRNDVVVPNAPRPTGPAVEGHRRRPGHVLCREAQSRTNETTISARMARGSWREG